MLWQEFLEFVQSDRRRLHRVSAPNPAGRQALEQRGFGNIPRELLTILDSIGAASLYLDGISFLRATLEEAEDGTEWAVDRFTQAWRQRWGEEAARDWVFAITNYDSLFVLRAGSVLEWDRGQQCWIDREGKAFELWLEDLVRLWEESMQELADGSSSSHLDVL